MSKQRLMRCSKNIKTSKDRPFHALIVNTMKRRDLAIKDFAVSVDKNFKTTFHATRIKLYKLLFHDVFPRKSFIAEAAFVLGLSESVLTSAYDEEAAQRAKARPAKVTAKVDQVTMQERALLVNFRELDIGFRTAILKVVKQAAKHRK